MKKLFTTLILLGVVITASARIEVKWGEPGMEAGTLVVEYYLTNHQGQPEPNAVGEFARKVADGTILKPDQKNSVPGNVTKLILKGEGFTNEDFNGGKMGEFIAMCAGEGKTLYLDLTDASGLVSKVNYTTTDKNPVKDAKYEFTNETEPKQVEKKTFYEYEDGSSFTGNVSDLVAVEGKDNEYTYSTEEWLLDEESHSWQDWELNSLNDGTYNQNNGTWNNAKTEYTYTSWDNGQQVEHKITKATVTKTVKSRTAWGYYGSNWPFPFIEVAESEVNIDSNDPTKGTIQVIKDGTAFAFGYVDQNGKVQYNYCGQYINGITFPKGDNFTAIPDKLCCTALCPNLETVVWGDQLTWIGADAFRGGIKGFDGDDSHYSPASELKKIGTMDAQGTVTFPTIKLPNTEGVLTDVNEGVVKFPNTLEVIGMDAFYECTSFRYVNLDLDNLVKVDAAAFNMRLDDQNHLDSVQMPSKTNTSLKFWGNQVFSSSHIKTLDFRYCEGIEHFAYDGTQSMEELDHNPVTGGQGCNTFYWHPYLTKLVLPPNLKYLSGGDANKSIVVECKNLETVEFTGRGTYDGNCNLTNGLIIPDYAFAYATNTSDPNGECDITVANENGGSSVLRKLKNVILSDRISQINQYAFNKTYIETLHIPASVSRIQQHAFNECRNLKVVVFDDVKAPNTCSAQTVVEGESGSGAFYNCAGITDVYVNNTTEELICENYAFDFGITWGHANPSAPFATLHFPKDFIDHYVNLAHPLTDDIAKSPALFHKWLHKHIYLAGVPNKNGWWEFINAGPMNTTIEEEPVCQEIILRTFSDYFYSYLVPDGLRAYVVSEINKVGESYEVTLQRINAIPKQTGVILYGHPNGRNLNGQPILSLTPVEFAKYGETLDDGTEATYDHGKPLCRANWNDQSNYVKNYLEPTSTPTLADIERLTAQAERLQNKINNETDNDKKNQLIAQKNEVLAEITAAQRAMADHPEWKNGDVYSGGKYLKPFENIVDDNPTVVNASTGVTDVLFRNFTLGRYSGTLHLSGKAPLTNNDTEDYAAFFRIDPDYFTNGKAYLHVMGKYDENGNEITTNIEYDQPQGAQILVKPDTDGDVKYYMEFKKGGSLDPNATPDVVYVNYRTDAQYYQNETNNPKHWWDDRWGFDWGITDKFFSYKVGEDEIITSRMNWGNLPEGWATNPQMSNLKYLGEMENADGIVKLVIPANNDGEYYTLQGIKVTNPTKGIYIRDGKKVIIK